MPLGPGRAETEAEDTLLTPGSAGPPGPGQPPELTWQLIYQEDAGAFQGCTQLPEDQTRQSQREVPSPSTWHSVCRP